MKGYITYYLAFGVLLGGVWQQTDSLPIATAAVAAVWLLMPKEKMPHA